MIATDAVDPEPAREGVDAFLKADLTDLGAVARLAKGRDVILHFGAISDEAEFNAIAASNIAGCYAVFEAARGARARVVFASSHHAFGFHLAGDQLEATAEYRPDTLYGLSKAYGELMARLYWDKYRVESVLLRIGSCTERPSTVRELSTWLSFDDLERLVVAAAEAPDPGFARLWGVSANRRRWWRHDDAARLGYRPADDSEAFAPFVTGDLPAFQGGPKCHEAQGGPL